MADVLVRAIDHEAGIRAIAAVTTELAREAAQRHGVEGLGACALGRALTASLLLSTLTKGDERVTVQIRGDGPLGGVTVDASADGVVRGYVHAPAGGRLPCRGRGRVVEVIGRRGVIHVVRDLGLKERYEGQIDLITGEVDEDVEAYLRRSEQVPSALGCEVAVEVDGVVASAGVLVQALPVEPDGLALQTEELREAMHAMRSGALWEVVRGGAPTTEALLAAAWRRPLQRLDERPLRFRCRCTTARVEESLLLLTEQDFDEMIVEGQAEVVCNYCNEKYLVGRERLAAIREQLLARQRERN